MEHATTQKIIAKLFEIDRPLFFETDISNKNVDKYSLFAYGNIYQLKNEYKELVDTMSLIEIIQLLNINKDTDSASTIEKKIGTIEKNVERTTFWANFFGILTIVSIVVSCIIYFMK